MLSMTNNFNPNQLRGQPDNAGSWVAHANGDPESALPEVPEPRILRIDSMDVALTNLGGGRYRVAGLEENYSDEFSFPEADTRRDLIREARKVYDQIRLDAAMAEDPNKAAWNSVNGVKTGWGVWRDRLEGSSDFEEIDLGDSAGFDNSLEYFDDAIDHVEVYRSDDNKLSAVGSVCVNLKESVDELDDDEADDFLNHHNATIEKFLLNEYGATSSGDTWENDSLEFVVNESDLGDEDFPTDIGSVADLLTERTKIVDLHNDMNGAYQGRHMYSFHTRLRQAMDAADDAEYQAYSDAFRAGGFDAVDEVAKAGRNSTRYCATCDHVTPLSHLGTCLVCGS